MPEMQDLYKFAIVGYPIVDENRGMNQLADSRKIGDRTADIREASEQVNVIEKSKAEAFGRPWEV